MYVIDLQHRPARGGERGQVLPLWIVAIVSTLTLMFLGMNYANTIRWQIRAQNAADSAAAALMSVQTQRFNEESIMLYASDIEEMRLRHLLDGLLLAMSGSGGCTGFPSQYTPLSSMTFNATGGTTCEQVYNDLRGAYVQSVNRYTSDVGLLNSVAYYATYTGWKSDAAIVLAHIGNASYCNQANSSAPNVDGGDCAMKYTLNGTNYRSAATGYPLGPVKFDANTIFIPGQGQLTNSWTGPNDSENANYFAPAMVDVVTCVKVPPIVPSFGVFTFPSYYAIGRAGATAAPVTGDWMQPGGITDPVRTVAGTTIPFQPYEKFTAALANQSPDYYGMNFNSWTFQTVTYQPSNGPFFQGYSADYAPNYTFNMVWMPWWGVLPIDGRSVDSTPVKVTSDC